MSAAEWADQDGDGIGDNADEDRDADGHDNAKDHFPDHATNWKDSDGDGIADADDAYPLNPYCWTDTLPCNEKAPPKAELESKAAPDPAKLDMQVGEKGVPVQGFDEYEIGKTAKHETGKTYTSDWQGEAPGSKQTAQWTSKPEAKLDYLMKVCAKHPKSKWCKHYVLGRTKKKNKSMIAKATKQAKELNALFAEAEAEVKTEEVKAAKKK